MRALTSDAFGTQVGEGVGGTMGGGVLGNAGKEDEGVALGAVDESVRPITVGADKPGAGEGCFLTTGSGWTAVEATGVTDAVEIDSGTDEGVDGEELGVEPAGTSPRVLAPLSLSGG